MNEYFLSGRSPSLRGKGLRLVYIVRIIISLLPCSSRCAYLCNWELPLQVSFTLTKMASGMSSSAFNAENGNSDSQYNAVPETQEKQRTPWQRWKNKWLRMNKLIYWTLLGVAVGVGLGLALYHANCSRLTIEIIGYPGEMLIRALEELILPLIVFALMVGILNLRHTPGGTGRIVRWSLFYYILSMLLAVGVGIILVEIIKPGKHTNFNAESSNSCNSSNKTATAATRADKNVVDSLLNIGRDFLPTNIVAAAAQPNYLGVILFAVIFASAVSAMGPIAEPFIQIVDLCNMVILKIIRMVIACTPIGVASLIASTILKACDLGGLLKALGLYVGTILTGFFVHSVIVLPLAMFILCRRNPFKAAKSFLPALVMGVGTSSSAATMPLTMQSAENHGCARSIVQFVIPLGTNINRDGAALYEAVSVIFILQANGVSLTAGNIVVVVITATLAAIGSASVPNSALVTMITVLQALGYSQYIQNVAILYAVDWFLGMLRTAVNIWGDAVAVVVVDTWATNYANKNQILPVTSPHHNKDQESVSAD